MNMETNQNTFRRIPSVYDVKESSCAIPAPFLSRKERAADRSDPREEEERSGRRSNQSETAELRLRPDQFRAALERIDQSSVRRVPATVRPHHSSSPVAAGSHQTGTGRPESLNQRRTNGTCISGLLSYGGSRSSSRDAVLTSSCRRRPLLLGASSCSFLGFLALIQNCRPASGFHPVLGSFLNDLSLVHEP
ncbi:hypothetical protein PVAP13_3KG277227 [Panicum virgatum]|uniref:Uncharacterized protein n=1 Tax=Panicum virgatum TaxID=38727 RepID=A0A8T0UZB5_PANVG|nr:hypothetical protein PVAP13_3KG277227 [Panicum virgatum]